MIWVNSTADIKSLRDDEIAPEGGSPYLTADPSGRKRPSATEASKTKAKVERPAPMGQDAFKEKFLKAAIEDGMSEEGAMKLYESVSQPAEEVEEQGVIINGKVMTEDEARKALSVTAPAN